MLGSYHLGIFCKVCGLNNRVAHRCCTTLTSYCVPSLARPTCATMAATQNSQLLVRLWLLCISLGYSVCHGMKSQGSRKRDTPIHTPECYNPHSGSPPRMIPLILSLLACAANAAHGIDRPRPMEGEREAWLPQTQSELQLLSRNLI